MKRVTAFLLTFFLSAAAYAGMPGDESPVSQGAGYLINTMYGATGIALATCAIIGVGLLCLIHVLEWKRLMQTIIGVCIIFGAGAVVTGVSSLVHH